MSTSPYCIVLHYSRTYLLALYCSLYRHPFGFQIFRPTCGIGEQFCQHNHSCIPSSATCQETGEFSCNADEIYCMHRGRCIPHKTSSVSKCDAVRDFHFTSVPADYALVYQYTARASIAGHLVFELKDSEMFQAKPGDVIGWTFSATASSGQVAYATIAENSVDAPEYEFPLVNEIGKKAARANGVKRNVQHILSAHFRSKAHFTLHHVYNHTGAYYITTGIAPTIVVYVDEHISGIVLSCPKLLTTNSTFDLTIAAHNGTNTTYEWLPGDGRLPTTTINGKYSLNYPKPGTYMFSLAAYNSLGRVTRMCTIKALDKVSGLTLLQPIAAVSIGQHSVISWTVQYGTNVTYTVDLGDGSAKKVFDMSGKSSNKMTLLYTYANIGKYTIKITANNIIGPLAVISTTAAVQVPLGSLRFITTLPHVGENAYAAKDDKVELRVELSQGSNAVCTYRFGDGSADVETGSLTVRHVYSKLGEHNANVSCRNDISEVQSALNATIIVQDLHEITDMKLVAGPTSFGNATDVSLKMLTGSVYFCDWDLGDGHVQRTDFKMTQSPLKYIYKAIGDYKVTVTCKNRLGQKSANITVSVAVPITGFQIQCPAMYLRVGQPFELKASTQSGSHVEMVFDLGKDQESRKVYQNGKGSSSVTHSYSKPGYYKIKVTATNGYNSALQGCLQIIKVEYPVSGVRIISNSPLTFVPGIVKYSWFPSPDFVPPTDAVISWDFGDGRKINRMPISFQNLSTLIGTYKYNSTGVFITKVQIENNVSSITFDLSIDVQKMLPVLLVIAARNPVTNQQIPGFGANRDFFALKSELSLSVTKQSKDNWYFFEFGNGQTRNSSVEQIAYKYTAPGTYNVTAAIDNVLSRTKKWKVITMQASIKGLRLNVDSIVHLKTAATFSILADEIGTAACYILNLGDGNVTVFTNSLCDFVKYSINKYVYKPLPAASFSFNHTYATKGKYNVSLEAKNVVSFAKVVKGIEVIYKPCAMPTVEINGGGSMGSPRNILRSDRIVLRANVTFSCDKASHVLYTWAVFKATGANAIDQTSPLNVTTIKAELPLIRNSGTKDPTIYEIMEKQLQLGVSAVKLTVKFESLTHDVADVVGSSTVWINTQATPLKAVIKGKIYQSFQ